jgi:hypothetical protein
VTIYNDKRFKNPDQANASSSTLNDDGFDEHLLSVAASMKPEVVLKTRRDPQVGLDLGLHTNTNPDLIDEDGGVPDNDDTLPRVEVYYDFDYSTPEGFERSRQVWTRVSMADKQFGAHGLSFAVASDTEYNNELEFEWGMGQVLKDEMKVIAFSGGGRTGEKYVMSSDTTLEDFCSLFMYKSMYSPADRIHDPLFLTRLSATWNRPPRQRH